MVLAINTAQPYSEVLTWNDRDVATAWHLIEQAQKKTRGDGRGPGAGGPQYSG